MKLHNLLEMMPRSAAVQIGTYYDEPLFRGTAEDALKSLENAEVFTFFSLSDCDCEYGSVLYISLED